MHIELDIIIFLDDSASFLCELISGSPFSQLQVGSVGIKSLQTDSENNLKKTNWEQIFALDQGFSQLYFFMHQNLRQ